MKKFISLLILALAPAAAFPAAYELLITQRNSTDSGYFGRNVLAPSPAPNTSGIFMYDGSTTLPKHALIGTGLSYDGTTLSATATAQVNADWNAVSGPEQILNKPTLFNGAYSSLTGVPSTFAPSGHTHAAGDITSGTLADARIPSLAISKTTGLQAALDAKLTIPTGGASQCVLGNGTVGTCPAVTSVTAGTGLSGGTITSTGTISLPNTGTAGTYTSVTTDAPGRVTAGTVISINDAPGRTMVTATNATGFQISSTRNADVCYEGTFQTTTTIGGPSSITVFLETADTNSTTPGDWTIKAQQVNSSTATLAVALQVVDVEPWSLCRKIPAGKFVRIRSGSVTGTATAAINTQQQETLL